MKRKTRGTPPASFGTPRDMQKTRTGEGTSPGAEAARNDGVGPNPLGSSRSDKSGRNSGGRRSLGKNRRKTLNFGIFNVRTLLKDGKFELFDSSD